MSRGLGCASLSKTLFCILPINKQTSMRYRPKASPPLYNNWEKASGRVCWESPANIALIKYWGKRPVQLPLNPSLSFVLRNSVVRITMDYALADAGRDPGLKSFTLNGRRRPFFQHRVAIYLQHLKPYFSFLSHFVLSVKSESSFPHSAGIASSAAAFSALALCLCSIEQELTGHVVRNEEFFRQASFLARLGSGSACRSMEGGFVLWGETPMVAGSDNKFGVRIPKVRVHPAFTDLGDAILIVDDQEKKVSSSEGHELMKKHAYRANRKRQALDNLEEMLMVLHEGDSFRFVSLIENEALSLHALMMASRPGYLLMKPNTLAILERIRAFREKSGIHLAFTMDAGPNVHLIYLHRDAKAVEGFIRKDLLKFCKDGRWIADGMGNGPSEIKTS